MIDMPEFDATRQLHIHFPVSANADAELRVLHILSQIISGYVGLELTHEEKLRAFGWALERVRADAAKSAARARVYTDWQPLPQPPEDI